MSKKSVNDYVFEVTSDAIRKALPAVKLEPNQCLLAIRLKLTRVDDYWVINLEDKEGRSVNDIVDVRFDQGSELNLEGLYSILTTEIG
jgi:hypothetical protein